MIVNWNCIRSSKDRAPIFCISFANYDISTGYVGCTGLFYKVERRIIEGAGTIKEEYKIGNNIVGVLGQSMGAATIGYYLGSNEAQQDLDFAVMDCSYSGMYDEIVWELSKGKAPLLTNTVVSLGSIFCDALYGYSFKDVNIVARIKDSTTPTLILHSKADQKCPYFMAKKYFRQYHMMKKNLFLMKAQRIYFLFGTNQTDIHKNFLVL